VLERKAHILGDRHVRIKRIVLEHHGDVPVLGFELVDDTAANGEFTLGDGLEPGDHAQ
jgi:hypothetical protein